MTGLSPCTLNAFEMHLRDWLLDQYLQELHRETGMACGI